jgi:DNA repair protein RecO (recombination protein O)
MQWQEDAVVLSARPHGESALLISLIAAGQGRHAGMVPGGQGRRNRALWQTGNLLRVTWQARLAEHLGTVQGEVRTPHASRWLDDPRRLAGLSAACALSEACVAERMPQPGAFAGLAAMLDGLVEADWPSLYVHWELGLLRALGYGLDLASCAATGLTDDLIYVSPKSGRAVSRKAGQPFHGRLLPLPSFLRQGGPGTAAEVQDGLSLTGFFLETHVLAPQNRALPPARSRLVERLRA